MKERIKRHTEPRTNPRSAETKKYRIKHKEKIREKLAQWRLEHKEYQRKYNRSYYIAHRDELIQRATEYKQAIRALNQRRKREGAKTQLALAPIHQSISTVGVQLQSIPSANL